MRSKLLVIVYWLLFSIFTIYSYAFLDLGLTLTSFKPYLILQEQIRSWGYLQRNQSVIIFILLISLFFIVYYLLIRAFIKGKILLKQVLFLSVLICLVLTFAYPAFSHDIFNYIFNAKMVLVFGANPHIKLAVDFVDPMLDFMRNVHTPAPYFYGWTLISLLPYILGLGRIFPELISFKIFSAIFFLFNGFVLNKIYSIYKLKLDKLRLVLFLLNPLILIEVVAVGHNDLVMMAFALLAFYFLIKTKNRDKNKKQKKVKLIILSLFFILTSISIKYATVVLLPLMLIWYFRPKLDLGFWGAVILFCLPFTRPLDQFHSWYLIWPLTWSFLSKNIKVIYFFVFLSFLSLFRYAPYIFYGYWHQPVLQQRLMIYFIPPLIYLAYRLTAKIVKPK